MFYFQVLIHLDMTGAGIVYLCFHAKNQYVPGWNSLFDNRCIDIPSIPNTRFVKNYELTLTEAHQLDKGDNPCWEKEMTDGKNCVINSIQKEMGCMIKVLANNKTLPSHLDQCSAKEQISEYATALYKVTNLSPLGLYTHSGCKAACSRNKWKPLFIGKSCLEEL